MKKKNCFQIDQKFQKVNTCEGIYVSMNKNENVQII